MESFVFLYTLLPFYFHRFDITLSLQRQIYKKAQNQHWDPGRKAFQICYPEAQLLCWVTLDNTTVETTILHWHANVMKPGEESESFLLLGMLWVLERWKRKQKPFPCTYIHNGEVGLKRYVLVSVTTFSCLKHINQFPSFSAHLSLGIGPWLTPNIHHLWGKMLSFERRCISLPQFDVRKSNSRARLSFFKLKMLLRREMSLKWQLRIFFSSSSDVCKRFILFFCSIFFSPH